MGQHNVPAVVLKAEGKCFRIQILEIRGYRIEIERSTERLLSDFPPVRLWAFITMRCKCEIDAFCIQCISRISSPPRSTVGLCIRTRRRKLERGCSRSPMNLRFTHTKRSTNKSDV